MQSMKPYYSKLSEGQPDFWLRAGLTAEKSSGMVLTNETTLALGRPMGAYSIIFAWLAECGEKVRGPIGCIIIIITHTPSSARNSHNEKKKRG